MDFSTWWAKEWHNKPWITGALEMAFREVAEHSWNAAKASATPRNSAMAKLLDELQALFDNEDPRKCERAIEIFKRLRQ